MKQSGHATEWTVPGRGALVVLAVIVFVSGFCSLAYQVVWLREFRLIFGGAAPAAAAVLAVFMGGLGLGGLMLGKRVDDAGRPGRWYAGIEGGITLAVLLSPLLLWLVRQGYVMTGGVQTLGLGVATVVQILMTVVVIGPACFLMGGTLPAVLRVAQTDADAKRATTALFYGVNVAGAVTGAFIATFVLLEMLGNVRTLMLACGANLLIAGGAYVLLQGQRAGEAGAVMKSDGGKRVKKGAAAAKPVAAAVDAAPAGLAGWFGPGAAFASGFAFFLIELVWYRASIPIFGGSVYNFGLILAVALAGIGSGSLVYSQVLRRREATLGLFAWVSALLALTMIVPFAMGDRLAYGALLLNTFFLPRSFEWLVFGWTVICVILVFLPAFFAGIQFPLLISLVGSGGRRIATQVGRIYAWNTLGAVSGALIGGFVLIPGLSITGSWRLAALVALAISVTALVLRFRGRMAETGGVFPAVGAMACGALALVMALGAGGPSAYWLHHPIGYGRANALFGADPTFWVDYVRNVNRSLVEAKDGRETSVAVTNNEDLSILSNGKSDSSAIGDSSTTVMLGLLGAILHPGEVRTACVVGYGTGVTAGWMGKIPTLEQLDIMELERAMIDLASHFRLVNFDVPDSPKSRVLVGDAREMLLTRPQTYDFISSEPSNLHRAGVANLYTREFYESVSARLNPDGIFCQWVQVYEMEMETVKMVIATLVDVFPKIELWQADSGDLMLICSKKNQPWDMALVRQRLTEEPYLTGVRNLWGTTTLEGFFARAVANADYARWVAEQTEGRNRDDWNILEFRAARSLGVSGGPVMDLLHREADARGELIPGLVEDKGGFDPLVWIRESIWKRLFFQDDFFLPRPLTGIEQWPDEVLEEAAFVARIPRMTGEDQVAEWPLPITTEAERLQWVGLLGQTGDARFAEAVEEIRESWPAEYHVLRAENATALGDAMLALEEYFAAIEVMRTRPIIRNGYQRAIWPGIERAIPEVEFTSVEQLAGFFEAASRPLSFAAVTDPQRRVMMSLAMPMPLEYRIRAAEAWGEYPAWNRQVLEFRRDVFGRAGHPGHRQAVRDFERWERSVSRQALEETTEER